MNDLSSHESPDKSQISNFLLCNYIDLFIPVAILDLESDRLFNHAQSVQLAGDKGHTISPGTECNFSFQCNKLKKSSFSNKKEIVIVPLTGQVMGTYGLYVKDYSYINYWM